MRMLLFIVPLCLALGACAGLQNLKLPDMMDSTTGGGVVDTGPITELEFRIVLKQLKVFLPEDLAGATEWTPTPEQADLITLVCGRYNARTFLVQDFCDRAAKVSAENLTTL